MKRKFVCIILLIALCLTACGRLATEENDYDGPSKYDGLSEYQEVRLSGQAGTISVHIPEGWESISFPASEISDSYKIQFYPENVEKGYIELEYWKSFAVCGTGLVSKKITIAGDTANMGTYDKKKYWDFIAYNGKNKGLVASTFDVADWWDVYATQVMEILNTASINAED